MPFIGAGIRRHLRTCHACRPSNGAAESFVSFIRLFAGLALLASRLHPTAAFGPILASALICSTCSCGAGHTAARRRRVGRTTCRGVRLRSLHRSAVLARASPQLAGGGNAGRAPPPADRRRSLRRPRARNRHHLAATGRLFSATAISLQGLEDCEARSASFGSASTLLVACFCVGPARRAGGRCPSRPYVRRTPRISCEAVPASIPAGAGMRRHLHTGHGAAESFVSFIRLFGGTPPSPASPAGLGTSGPAASVSLRSL